MNFLNLQEFKRQIGAESINVLRNDKTNKLFVSANGSAYKCQQDIDLKAEIAFMFEDSLTDGCLINVSRKAEVLATL